VALFFGRPPPALPPGCCSGRSTARAAGGGWSGPAAGHSRRSTGGKPRPGREGRGADAGCYGYADCRSRRRAAKATPAGRPSETLRDCHQVVPSLRGLCTT
jgi:hypothetical protein